MVGNHHFHPWKKILVGFGAWNMVKKLYETRKPTIQKCGQGLPIPYHPCMVYLSTFDWLLCHRTHRENGGTLGMVPLIINPKYNLYIVGIYWGPYPLLKGSNRGLKQLGIWVNIPYMDAMCISFSFPWGGLREVSFGDCRLFLSHEWGGTMSNQKNAMGSHKLDANVGLVFWGVYMYDMIYIYIYNIYKVGPLLVINIVMTPINGRK